MNNKKVSISRFHGEFEVAITRNGFQWATIYSNRDRAFCEIIAEAFEEVGCSYKKQDAVEEIDGK